MIADRKKAEILSFAGPARIVHRTIRLDAAVACLGEYDNFFELNKVGELRFAERVRGRRLLNLIRVDALPTLRDEPPYLIAADDRAVERLRRGDKVRAIVLDGLTAVVRHNYNPPLMFSATGDIYRTSPADEEGVVAVRAGIDFKGRVTVEDNSETGTWVSADWSQAA